MLQKTIPLSNQAKYSKQRTCFYDYLTRNQPSRHFIAIPIRKGADTLDSLRINVMRIGELSRRSGVPKQLIHYYLRREYLHPPIFKKGNQAYYDETHLERLLFLEQCKEERVPLSYAVTLGQKRGTKVKRDRRAEPQPDRAVAGTAEAGTRARIIEVASKIFLSKGYVGTTIAEVMSAVGITKPSFYYYFKNKKDLYLTCLDSIFKGFSARAVEEIRQERDPVERIKMRWQAALTFSSKLLTANNLLKESLRDLDVEQRRRAEGILHRSLVDPLMKDLDRGIKSGIFREVESEIISVALINLIDTFAYRGIIDRRHRSEDILRVVFDLIMHGLLKKV